MNSISTKTEGFGGCGGSGGEERKQNMFARGSYREWNAGSEK